MKEYILCARGQVRFANDPMKCCCHWCFVSLTNLRTARYSGFSKQFPAVGCVHTSEVPDISNGTQVLRALRSFKSEWLLQKAGKKDRKYSMRQTITTTKDQQYVHL